MHMGRGRPRPLINHALVTHPQHTTDGCHVLVAQVRRHRSPACSSVLSTAPWSPRPESAPTRPAPHHGCPDRPAPAVTPALPGPAASTGSATSAGDDRTHTPTTSAGRSPVGWRTTSETTRAVSEPAASAKPKAPQNLHQFRGDSHGYLPTMRSVSQPPLDTKRLRYRRVRPRGSRSGLDCGERSGPVDAASSVELYRTVVGA